MEKQKNIPALRFPEFGGEEWAEKRLGEVTRYTKGYAFKSGDYSNCGERIIRVSDLGANSIRYENEKIFINKQKVTTLFNYKIDKGDIIITTVGSKPELLESAVGRGIFINKSSEGYLNQNLLKINQSRDVDNRFIFGYINSKKYTTHIKQIQRGNANQSNITVADLFKFEVKIPIISEQRRIANFLAVIDEKLQALKKKKALLEQYKKGVMQKIFSQELRFKDENGNNFADWEKKKLGDVGIFFSGGTPLTTKRKYFNGEIPFIRSGEINSDKTLQFITEEGLKNSSAKMVEAGDLLYALYGATSGEVAISKIKGAINQAILCIRSNLNNKFLYNYLLLEKENIIKTYLQGGQGNLSAEIIKSLKVSVPSISEQQKIANFLTTIDEKINQQQNQIEKVSHYKKGLLQQMFC